MSKQVIEKPILSDIANEMNVKSLAGFHVNFFA